MFMVRVVMQKKLITINNNNNKYFKKWVVDGNNRGYGKQKELY